MSALKVERLFNWYREYIGEPDREIDLYVGFALFFGGAAIAVFALGVYGSTALAEIGSDLYWQLREISFALAAVSLPTTLLGIIVLLPVDRRSIGAGLLGHLIILGVTWFFMKTYPYQWNVAGNGQQALWGMVVYSVGILLLTATTAAALISYHIERSSDTAGGADASDGGGVEVTEEQVEQDIEEAMEDAELTWGGVYRDDSTPDLSIQGDDDGDGGLSGNVEGNTERVSTSVSDNVAGLQALKSEQDETALEDSTQSQADALAELRRKQQKGEAPAPDDGHPLVRHVHRAHSTLATVAAKYGPVLAEQVSTARSRLSEAIDDGDATNERATESPSSGEESSADSEEEANSATEPDRDDDDDDDGDDGLGVDLDPDIDLDEHGGTDLEETGVVGGDDGDE